MPPHYISVSFRKVKRVGADRHPRKKNNVALAGVGHQGINQAIRSLQIKKQTKEEAGIIVLMHPDSNFLTEAEARASKFIPHDRIFSIHINMLNGNGNGKSFKRCIDNYPNWRGLIDDILPKIVKRVNKHGSWILEAHTSSGGSSPVLVYFIEKTNGYFHFKIIVVGEPCGKASEKNLPEFFSRLTKFDNTCKIVYTKNSEVGVKREELDWSNVSAVNAITCGCGSDGFDVVDFMELMPDEIESKSCKFVEVSTGLGIIPHFRLMLFWEVQNYERTLQVVKTLLAGVKIGIGEMGFLVGKVSPEIAQLGIENAYPIDTPLLHRKIIKVGIEDWNLVAGKAVGFIPQNVATPNFDLLEKMMVKNDKNKSKA